MTYEEWKEYHRMHERPITVEDLKEVKKLYDTEPMSLIDLARQLKRQPITILRMLAAKGDITAIKQPEQPKPKTRPSAVVRGTSTCPDST